ncbi:methylglutaconyl-CoA hydratase, mitochondrial-like [Sycon ciliatum]|uniref:methylglutaconyl-CoA hydratase, mitochondrial-like n=1 Tax=Sycon ciliatum TaxID=27933 RepID=UPI0031F64365
MSAMFCSMLRRSLPAAHHGAAVRFMCSENQPYLFERLSGENEGIGVISMNRAKVNALGKETLTFMNSIMSELSTDKATRVLILRSIIPGVFCAGADLKERVKFTEDEVRMYVRQAQKMITDLEQLKMPVIGALDGHAMGGGLEFALACDFRVAATNAKMGLVETRLAIIPGAGGTQRLSRLVGRAKAKYLIFTAAVLKGEEAAKIGLVDEVVDQNDAGDAAYHAAVDMARKIVPQGPIAVAAAKQAVNQGIEQNLADGLNTEWACYEKVIPTKDRIEGLMAFKEKRKPVYRGE